MGVVRGKSIAGIVLLDCIVSKLSWLAATIKLPALTLEEKRNAKGFCGKESLGDVVYYGAVYAHQVQGRRE
jgi:hypothetical protein